LFYEMRRHPPAPFPPRRDFFFAASPRRSAHVPLSPCLLVSLSPCPPAALTKLDSIPAPPSGTVPPDPSCRRAGTTSHRTAGPARARAVGDKEVGRGRAVAHPAQGGAGTRPR